MRELRRIYRIFGLRPFGLPIVLLLAIAVILDGQLREYDELQESREQLEKQARQMRMKLGQRQQIESNLKERQADLAATGNVAMVVGALPQARAGVAALLEQSLNATRAQSVAVTPLTEEANGELSVIKTKATFTAVPQQLTGWLAALRQRKPAVRVDRLEIASPDPALQQLMVNIEISNAVSLPPTTSGTKK